MSPEAATDIICCSILIAALLSGVFPSCMYFHCELIVANSLASPWRTSIKSKYEV